MRKNLIKKKREKFLEIIQKLFYDKIIYHNTRNYYKKNQYQISGQEVRYADNLSKNIVNKIFKDIKKKNDLKFLELSLGQKETEFLFKKRILLEVTNFYQFKLIERNSKDKNLYFSNDVISYSILSYIIKNLKIKKIDKISMIKSFFKEKIKFLYYFFRSLVYLEFFFWKCKKIKNNANYHLACIINPYDVPKNFHYTPIETLRFFPEFLINNKFFSKKKNLLLLNKKLFIKKKKLDTWKYLLKKKKFDYFYIGESYKCINKKDFFFNFYLKNFLFRFKIINLICKNHFISSEIFELLETTICWSVFFNNNKVKYFFSNMIPDDIGSNVIKQKHGSKTFFAYYATHGQVPNKLKFDDFTENSDFSFLKYNTLISNKTSLEWFNKQQNLIENFVNVGSLTSQSVIHLKSPKLRNKIRKLNALKTLKKRKTVSFFDHQLGMGGMMTEKDLKDYFDLFFYIVNKFKNINFIFKCKYTSVIFNKILEQRKLKNNINNNFFIFTDIDIEAYELLAISDMVISFPHSSIVDESLSSNIKTFIYDPNNRYSSKNYWYNKIKNLRIINKKKLVEKIRLLEINKLTNKNNLEYEKIMDLDLNFNYLEKFVKELN